MDKPPYLTIVDNSTSTDHDEEFVPLPYFSWSERPASLPLDVDECATAIHLAHGDIPSAAELLKVPPIRLHRLLRGSPRLQRVLEESFALTLYRAVSIPIRTLHDANADHRRLEWASTQVLKSRLASGHPFSPAPAASLLSATPAETGTIVFRWGDGRTLDGEVKSSPLVEGEKDAQSGD